MVDNKSLEDFVKKKEKILTILGIFLVVLPLSFSEIRNIDQNYAGYFAMFSLSILVLLYLEIFNGEEDYSQKVNLFNFFLLALGIIFFLSIRKLFLEQTVTFIDYGVNVLFMVAGAILMTKLTDNIKAKNVELSIHALIFGVSLLIVIFYAQTFHFISRLFSFLSEDLHFYLGLFMVGFLGVFVLFGIFVSGLEKIMMQEILPLIKNKLRKYL